jgi:hypothetical protein
MGTRFHHTPRQPKNTNASNSVPLELVYLLRWILLNFLLAPRLPFKFLLCPACGGGVCKINGRDSPTLCHPGVRTPVVEGEKWVMSACRVQKGVWSKVVWEPSYDINYVTPLPINKTGQVKTSKSKFPPKICHIDSIYGSKALETAFYFMQLLRRP